MKYALASFAAALLLAGSAIGQHKHGDKGPNGGPMEDVAGVHAELLTSGTTVTVNIYDEGGKPLSTAGYSGAALVTAGAERETVQLAPSGASALKGEAKKAVPAGATIAVTLKTGAGKSGQAKFSK